MKYFIYTTIVVISASIFTGQAYAQKNSESANFLSSGSIITTINFGYLGAERDRNFNHEFEKSFKNLSYDLRFSYFLTNTIALSSSISNIITSRNLFDYYNDIGAFKIDDRSIKLGLGAGYYHPITLNNKSTRLFIEGGLFRYSSTYKVSNYQSSIDKSYTGYSMATGFIVPLSTRLLLNLSLKRDAFPEDYILGTSQNGVYTEISRETKWNSEINLNIGFSIKF